MIARAFPLLLLVLLLGLLGCRDTLVDEQPAQGTNSPPADTTTENSMYLKGPNDLRVGETRNYRAEPITDAVTYRWSLAGGTGVVSGTPVHPRFQLYDITGVADGPVRLTVQAFDENNAILRTGTKVITVLP